MYKFKGNELKVFICHLGGPFYKNKNEGYWSIPKGEVEIGESDLLKVALREMKEETDIDAPKDKEKYIFLDAITQKSGKIVHCWAFEGDWSGLLMGNSFVEILYNGEKIKFPEIDKAGFFTIEDAKRKLNPAQVAFLDRLKEKLAN